jgi:probable HAF family extracellular repeat protein
LQTAFFWTPATGRIELGTLGGTYSQAEALNNAGEVVGVSAIAGDNTSHGFLWTLTNQRRRVDDGPQPAAPCSSARRHTRAEGLRRPPVRQRAPRAGSKAIRRRVTLRFPILHADAYSCIASLPSRAMTGMHSR